MVEHFKETLLDFDKVKSEQIMLDVASKNNGIHDVFTLVSDTLSELGTEWANGDIALSQIYMSSRICDELVEKLIPKESVTVGIKNPIAIATFMDFHLLGKKIIYSVMRASGFNIIDFGSVASEQELYEKVVANNIEILLISTLMYHSAIKIKDVRALFLKNNYNIKILVGGAPFIFDAELWKQVNADAMGISASEAIVIVNQWLKRN
jgi:methanogenic corrinoid protein MtbC1